MCGEGVACVVKGRVYAWQMGDTCAAKGTSVEEDKKGAHSKKSPNEILRYLILFHSF